MGSNWKESADSLRTGNLNNTQINNIIDALVQEEKDNGLQLTDATGHHIELITKGDRKEEIKEMLRKTQSCISKYQISQDKNCTFSVKIDFKLREIRCSTLFSIHKGKAQAQTTKLIRLLEVGSGINDTIIVDAIYPRNKSLYGNVSLNDLVNQKSLGKSYSILNKDFGDEIKHFEIKIIGDLTAQKFRSSKLFIIELEQYSIRFVEQVMQALIN
ncbi:MAG: hypothetical protein V3V09_00080 [Arenicellales bacterium]